MQTDKSLSFTATLHMGEDPVCILGEHPDGDVIVHDPNTNQPKALARALGVLIGRSQTAATTFYFRHVQGQYRLYVRSGSYLGQGIYCQRKINHDFEIPYARPVEDEDPICWSIFEAASGSPRTLNDLSDNNLVRFSTNTSWALSMVDSGEGIHFLEANGVWPDAELSLRIIDREADWLG